LSDPAKPHRPIEPAADRAPRPCRSCRYDLRGLPAGGRCPECGTTIPKALRKPASPLERESVREAFGSAWRSLAIPSLAPLLLLTPMPFSLPWGIVVPIVVGFAPWFRLLAMRRFAVLPEPFASMFERDLGLLRRLQWVEIAFAVVAALCAAIGTFSILPKAWVPVYFAVICGWWWAAMGILRFQLAVGERIAESLSDPAALPRQPVRRARIWAFLGQALALLGVGLAIAGMLFGSDERPGSILLPVGLVLVAGASLSGVYVALVAQGHAHLVAECIHENPELASHDPLPFNPLLEEADAGSGRPPRAETRFTPPHAPPEDDDTPIPLA